MYLWNQYSSSKMVQMVCYCCQLFQAISIADVGCFWPEEVCRMIGQEFVSIERQISKKNVSINWILKFDRKYTVIMSKLGLYG